MGVVREIKARRGEVGERVDVGVFGWLPGSTDRLFYVPIVQENGG